MKKLKPFKTTDAAVFYKVAKPAEVTRKLVEFVDWPETLRMVCFDFKPVKLNPARLPDFKLPAKYCVSLACYSPAGGVKASPAPASGIETREPKSFAEFKKAFRKDEKDFLKRFDKKLSPEAKGGYSLINSADLRKIKTLIAFKKDRQVGLFGHMPNKGVSGKTYDAITSWNLDAGLSAAERRSAFNQAWLWLGKTSRRQVSVVLGTFEKETLAAVAAAGFTTCRVCVERLSGVKEKRA